MRGLDGASAIRVVITDLIDDDLAAEREVLGKIWPTSKALQAGTEAACRRGMWSRPTAIIVYHLIHLTRRRSAGWSAAASSCAAASATTTSIRHWLGSAASPWQCAGLRHGGSRRLGVGMLLSLTRGIHRANSRLRAQTGRLVIRGVGTPCAAARPRAGDRRTGPHRHRHGAARQGAGHGCAVLRSLQARRLRQGAWAFAARRRSTNCFGSSLRGQSALPVDATRPAT